ncbi:MAG TPA: class A beta-lactamase, subclass A2 [Cytophagales bacterium]|nr:class A beta-lactamase, subclass A2 [Cytophagales bacterium]
MIKTSPFSTNLLIPFFFLLIFSSSAFSQNNDLRGKIERIIKSKKAEVGVAVIRIEDNDTLTINGNKHYPMQSVYKFHLALAVLNQVDKGKFSLDQKILVRKKDLLPDTWSPLREKYPKGNVEVPIRELLTYTVSQSDNNGADILFRLLGGTDKVDAYIKGLGIKDISIAATEEEMHEEWDAQFTNWSTTYTTARLLKRFYETNMLSKTSRDFLWKIMAETNTGVNRIKGLLPEGTEVAHKTGTSGTNKKGVTAAVNDAGIITLPDGKHLAVAVFVTNSKENEETNERIIAEIAKALFDHYSTLKEEVPSPSLDDKIGQMIMMGINERKSLSSTDPLRKELNANKMGGIILFEKNISNSNSYENLKKLISDLQAETSTPLFISIDEEGGKVHRLKEKYGFVAMPSAAYLGNLSNMDSTFFYADRLAAQLADLGINMNFAPAVDVAINPNNPIIAKVERSYSDDPEMVTQHALAFIKAHHKNGIKTTLKHFPGHGSSSSDTHKGLVDVTNQWQFSELIPYRKIIESGSCDAIVSCHVINCHLDVDCIPSTLSKTITTTILRGLLGFEGVVFSDDMQMYAISKNYGLETSVKMAINAGVDVLVFGNNVNLSDRTTASEIHAVIKKLVEEGAISENRIEEAYQRIIKLKQKTY